MGDLTAEQITEYGHRHADGIRAAAAGESIAACPWGPSDPEGYPWRAGWLDAETSLREAAGTFDHTPAEYEAALEGPELDHLRPDPVAALLSGDDDEVLVDGEWRAPEPAFVGIAVTGGAVYMRAVGAHGPWQHVGHSLSPVQVARSQEEQEEALRQLAAAWDPIARQITLVIDTVWTDVLEPFFSNLRGILMATAEDLAAASARAPSCPQHGEELRGGSCRHCDRQRARAATGSRGRR